jgi:hypothetical protein
MAKKQDTLSPLTIYLNPNYLGQKILVNLDEIRNIKFNAGEKVEITEQELKEIGNHRWLIVENYNGD